MDRAKHGDTLKRDLARLVHALLVVSSDRRRDHMKLWLSISVTLIAGAALAPGAWAAKPSIERFTEDDPIEFEAGEVCAFPVVFDPDAQVKFTTFSDGRTLVNGQGTYEVTNTLTEESVSLHVAGSVASTELANGDVQSTARGRILLFYFEGDTIGPGLFLSNGRTVDIFDATTGAITSTRLSGQRTGICALLS